MDLFEDTAGDNAPEFTVSEISSAVKKVIEGEFGRIRVRGEVGRVFKARSGHLYYDVKDDRNVLGCTTWKGQISGLSVVPEEGLEVVVTGKLSAFGAQSKYNMNVDERAGAGEGGLRAMREKRKKKLEAEGLFDPARKRKLPYLPEIIGVVTSPQGAVIRDILHRLRERFPRKVLVWPVAVQGERSAPEVAAAIRGFNALTPGGALPRPDLLIVARGGGSIEDLWGFNEEIVARAAAESAIPLISAVGHETDTTLIDFVSDHRAPTPTAAAELAVPVRLDLLVWVDGQDARLSRAVSQGVQRRRERLRDLARVLPKAEALLFDPRQRLDRMDDALPRALQRMVERKSSELTRLSGAIRPAALRNRLAAERLRLETLSGRLTPALSRVVSLNGERVKRQREALTVLAPRLNSAMAQGLKSKGDRVEALERVRRSVGYVETLKRGYAVVRDGEAIVTSATQAGSAAALELEFRDGRVRIGDQSKKPAQKSTKPPEQGTLL